MEKLKPYLFLFLAGFVYSLGHPNHLGFIIPFAPIFGTALLFYHIIKREGLKQKLLGVLFFNLVVTLLSFYWIANTLVEFGQVPLLLAILANTLYALLFNPYNFIFVLLFHYLGHKYKKQSFAPLSIVTSLTLIEYFFPQQFPVMLGQPWIVLSEYLGLASYFGLFGFSFFSYLLVWEILAKVYTKKFNPLHLVAIISFAILNPVISLLENKQDKTDLNIRIVQANISNFLKLSSESGDLSSVDEVIKKYENLSLLPSKNKLDLILWPETAYPYPITRNKEDIKKSEIPDVFKKVASFQQADVAIGGYDHFKDAVESHYYQTEANAAFLIHKDTTLSNVYQKHILIPFGETLPLGPLNEYASKILSEMAFFKEGETFPLFSLTNKPFKFIATICYELLKPEFIREYVTSTKEYPSFLINMTNDSWYGDTLEPEQHLFLTKWRSVEFKLPIVRSTNTGISVVIDKNGKEVERLNLNKEGNLDVSLSLNTKPYELNQLWYAKWGVFAFLPILLLLFLFQGILLKLKNE